MIFKYPDTLFLSAPKQICEMFDPHFSCKETQKPYLIQVNL